MIADTVTNAHLLRGRRWYFRFQHKSRDAPRCAIANILFSPRFCPVLFHFIYATVARYARTVARAPREAAAPREHRRLAPGILARRKPRDDDGAECCRRYLMPRPATPPL